MKRRDFLHTAGTALAGAALAPRRSHQTSPVLAPARSGERLKKAVKLRMVKTDLPLAEKFKLIKDVGFDGVELPSPNDFSRADVLRARDRSGLAIHGVLDAANWSKPLSSPDPEVRAESVKALQTALADAEVYGASTVLLVPAVVNKEVAYDAAWRRSQAGIRKALPAAEKHGVKIAIENVWNHFLFSPMECARYIDAFESDYVGAYLDIGNTLTYGWPAQWIRILGDRILKLDIKDRLRGHYDDRGQAVRVKLGEGSCDWTAIRRALVDIGYEGWATAEVRGGDRKRLREIAHRMDQVLGAL